MFLLLISCKKDKQKLTNYNQLVGNYEWFHSFNGSGTSYSTQVVEAKYGLTFLEKGKVLFYENGDCVKKARCISVQELQNGGLNVRIHIDKESIDVDFTLQHGQLENSNWPYIEFSNEFLKHNN